MISESQENNIFWYFLM